MKTIQQVNISNKEVLAIVSGEELKPYSKDRFTNENFFFVITFFNFNDGLKDNIEGITTVGILSDLNMAKIVFNVEQEQRLSGEHILFVKINSNPFENEKQREEFISLLKEYNNKPTIMFGCCSEDENLGTEIKQVNQS